MQLDIPYTLFQFVRATGRETDYTTLSAEFKNEWIFISISK
jgi:hypothetical protein